MSSAWHHAVSLQRQLRWRREREAGLRLLMEQLPAVVWSTDVNLCVTSSLGAGLDALRLSPCPSTDLGLAEYFGDDGTVADAHRRALGGESVDFELQWRGRLFQAHLEPMHDQTGLLTGTIGVALDITDRKRAEEQLRHAALHDPLTALPNRALFLARLQQMLERARREPGYRFAVMLMDLDRFKTITDSLGHLAGDRLLVAIARRLEACLGAGEVLVRFGGDEFTLLVEEIAHPGQATHVAERIQRALRQPLVVEGHEVVTSASIGIALGGAQYEQPEALLRDADTAMYRAKALGGGRHQFFDEGMHQEAVEALNLEMEMRRGLARGEFRVFYQPIVSLDTGQVRAVEALARWQHPERGLLLPDAFIPLAEETGLILPLGSWVLREACRQLGAWKAARGNRPLGLTVNLSARQLAQRDLVEELERTVGWAGLEGRRLTLEITENVIMEDAVAAGALLSRIRDRHLQVSMDDFGKGHSSLSQLHELPFDNLKIDRSFVSSMGARRCNREIVRAIVDLGHNLGMRVVAEGVETEAQLSALRALGCDEAQGYLFSPPTEASAAGLLVR